MFRFSLSTSLSLSALLATILSGCTSDPDFQCPDSMLSNEYSLESLNKIDFIQTLETRLEKINSQCNVPLKSKNEYEALLLRVAEKGTPEQAMWLYDKIQSYPKDFKKIFLTKSRYFGIADSTHQNEDKRLLLIDPQNVGEEVKSARISPEQASLAKSKYIEGMYADNPEESRRIVRMGKNRTPVLMQSLDEGSNGSSLIKVRFDSLLSGKEVSLRTFGEEASEWTPASEHISAGGYHQGRYKFVTNQNGDIKYAIEVFISADHSFYSNRGEDIPEATPCSISTRFLEFSESGFEYRRVLDSSSDEKCATNLNPTTKNQKTANEIFESAFEAAHKKIKLYRPIPYIAKYIDLSRGNEIDRLLVAQLRENGRAGRLQLLGAIYAANTLPKKEDFTDLAEYKLAKFESAASLIKAIHEVFSGIEPILNAIPTGLTDPVALYTTLLPDINENKPPKESRASEFSYMTFFINRELSTNNNPGHSFSYEAYRLSDRKAFAVFAGYPAFSGQGVFSFYGKQLESSVLFQSGSSGFSVEAPVIEMASQEMVEEIKINMKKISKYRQLISKLDQNSNPLDASFFESKSIITEVILRR